MVKIQDVIDIFTPEFNQLEAAIFTLFDLLDIENQTGEPLKNIARIVGTENIPDDEELLRVFIKGQIAKNVSKGTAPDLIKLWAIMSQATSPITQEIYPAEVELYTDTALPSGYETFIRDFMDNAAGAGVLIKHIIELPTSTTLVLRDANNPIIPDSQGLSSTLAPSTGGRLTKIIVQE